jgi:hypothetical protein
MDWRIRQAAFLYTPGQRARLLLHGAFMVGCLRCFHPLPAMLTLTPCACAYVVTIKVRIDEDARLFLNRLWGNFPRCVGG